MKKTLIYFLFIFFVLFPLVSADLSCSDNSELDWDQNEIDLGSTKSINGIRLGLFDSKIYNVIQETIIELIIQGVRSSLTTEIDSEIIEVLDEIYSISLINSTDEYAEINFDGDLKKIDVGSSKIVKNLEVAVFESSSLGAKFIIGTEKISLSNLANPIEIVNISNISYAIEIFTASNNNAIIKVSKCTTGKIQNLVQENANNNTEINESNVNIINNDNCSQTPKNLQDLCCQKELSNDNAFLNNQSGDCESPPNSIQSTNLTSNNTQSQINQTQNPGIIQRIINFFKRFFGFD